MNRAESCGLTGRDKLEFPKCLAKNCLNINQGLSYVCSEEVLMDLHNKELRISPSFVVGGVVARQMDSPLHWRPML